MSCRCLVAGPVSAKNTCILLKAKRELKPPCIINIDDNILTLSFRHFYSLEIGPRPLFPRTTTRQLINILLLIYFYKQIKRFIQNFGPLPGSVYSNYSALSYFIYKSSSEFIITLVNSGLLLK